MGEQTGYSSYTLFAFFIVFVVIIVLLFTIYWVFWNMEDMMNPIEIVPLVPITPSIPNSVPVNADAVDVTGNANCDNKKSHDRSSCSSSISSSSRDDRSSSSSKSSCSSDDRSSRSSSSSKSSSSSHDDSRSSKSSKSSKSCDDRSSKSSDDRSSSNSSSRKSYSVRSGKSSDDLEGFGLGPSVSLTRKDDSSSDSVCLMKVDDEGNLERIACNEFPGDIVSLMSSRRNLFIKLTDGKLYAMKNDGRTKCMDSHSLDKFEDISYMFISNDVLHLSTKKEQYKLTDKGFVKCSSYRNTLCCTKDGRDIFTYSSDGRFRKNGKELKDSLSNNISHSLGIRMIDNKIAFVNRNRSLIFADITNNEVTKGTIIAKNVRAFDAVDQDYCFVTEDGNLTIMRSGKEKVEKDLTVTSNIKLAMTSTEVYLFNIE